MAFELGVLEISSSELLKKDFEAPAGILKFSGELFLLSDFLLLSESVFTVSDGSLEVSKLLLKLLGELLLLSVLLWPSEFVFTVSDGSLEVSPELLLEETAKVVLFKAWGKVSRRELLEMELLEMELLLVSGILRCFAPPPIFTLETSEAGLICFLI